MPEPGRNESFFHGTSYDIAGGVVRPGREVGVEGYGNTGSGDGQASRDHAFATTDERVAWDFARQSGTPMGIHSDRRTRVYTVAPHPEMKPGAYHGMYNEYVAPSFNVEDRIDTKPGYQGTFPSINWKQFEQFVPNPEGIPRDVNHPTPHQVEHGMTASRPERMARLAVLAKASIPNRNQVSSNQMDLFSGRTAAEHHADYHEGSGLVKALAVYHRDRQHAYEPLRLNK
jgi:hypothetical protein